MTFTRFFTLLAFSAGTVAAINILNLRSTLALRPSLEPRGTTTIGSGVAV
jgi:hypothetical protein